MDGEGSIDWLSEGVCPDILAACLVIRILIRIFVNIDRLYLRKKGYENDG